MVYTHDYDLLLHLSSYNFTRPNFMQRSVMLCERYLWFWMHPSTFRSEAVPESSNRWNPGLNAVKKPYAERVSKIAASSMSPHWHSTSSDDLKIWNLVGHVTCGSVAKISERSSYWLKVSISLKTELAYSLYRYYLFASIQFILVLVLHPSNTFDLRFAAPLWLLQFLMDHSKPQFHRFYHSKFGFHETSNVARSRLEGFWEPVHFFPAMHWLSWECFIYVLVIMFQILVFLETRWVFGCTASTTN